VPVIAASENTLGKFEVASLNLYGLAVNQGIGQLFSA